ncbi:hypothetical protein C1J02_16260 [Sulfitobacter sp. SK011]|nr:hypothetical protein C1J02_16260 [Sulfitobacter sp. SK011]
MEDCMTKAQTSGAAHHRHPSNAHILKEPSEELLADRLDRKHALFTAAFIVICASLIAFQFVR